VTEAVERAQALRAEAARLRKENRRLRDEFPASRACLSARDGELTALRQRRQQIADRLGTWPYWAPPDPELSRVLVPLAEAA
jgi:hypothetical protein